MYHNHIAQQAILLFYRITIINRRETAEYISQTKIFKNIKYYKPNKWKEVHNRKCTERV